LMAAVFFLRPHLVKAQEPGENPTVAKKFPEKQHAPNGTLLLMPH